MLRPTAKKVIPLDNYRLRIVFDNAEERVFDVAPYIQGAWYGQLKNQAYFSRVTTDGFTVVWPDGQDICPDELYSLSYEVNA